MIKALVFAAVSFSVLGAGQAAPQTTASLTAAIQGTWKVSSVNGQALSGLGQTSTMTFSKDTYMVTTNGQIKEAGTFKIDATKKPAEIDMKITQGVAIGATQIGVVQIVNGELTIKTNTVGTPKRPTDFKSEPWYALIVARKQP